ncbi:MAG: lysylphosphatidylglycerol synthetase family protein [Desulfovibrio sp.]|nr:lysylphosphatidylglycerol synthetase family protein [Desulfovibrio sp.]
MKKNFFRYLGPVLVSAVFCLAIYLLYHKLKQYSIAEIRDSMSMVSSWRIFACLLGTAVSYVILMGYDFLAIRAIHKRLSLPRLCLVSFVGQTVSYNFGALLGGTAVRYRFYSAWNFTVTDIVRLVLMLAVTFWVGVLGTCGIFFVIAPPHIPEELAVHIPFADLRILGGILFFVAFIYIFLCFRVRHPIHVFGKEFVFPPAKLAVWQFIVASVDIIAAAFCMYILLPGSLGISFWDFVPSYLLAQVAVVLTHVPGGVGIFELVIINLTHTDQTQIVFAAVLLFRLFYYIIPLLLAALILAGYEVRTRRSSFRDLRRKINIISHSVAAYGTFGLGVAFLISAFYPLPYALIHDVSTSSAFLSALGEYLLGATGFLLLLFSYGLEHKESASLPLTWILLLLGGLGAFLHSGSYLLPLVAVVFLAVLFLLKPRFYRTRFFLLHGLPVYWLLASLVALLLVVSAALVYYYGSLNLETLLGNTQHINACRALRASFFLLLLSGMAFSLLRQGDR